MKVLAVLMLGCAIPAVSCGTGPDGNELDVQRNLDVAGVTVTDVFAPSGGHDLPVVVMLHGTGGEREVMEPLARAVAEEDVVVYLPSWPVIDQVAPYPAGDDEPPWPGIDCEPGFSHVPERFIGMGGDFTGEYQYATECPDFFHAYDPFSIEVTNSGLEVRLIHGVIDRAVCSRVSLRFEDHLRELGLDSAMVATDTGHSELRDPETPGGRFVVDQVTALIHDRPSVFETAGTPATLIAGDGACDYSGPFEIGRGGLLRLELQNPTSDPVWLSLVRIRPNSDISLEKVRADRSRAGEGAPGWVDTGDFFLMPAGSTRPFDWAFVEGGARWVIYCMADPNPGDPMKWPTVGSWGGPLLHAAAIISSGD